MTKVLTVDDSRAVRMIVTKHVKELGFEVDEAEDGEQGLTKLAGQQYDLLILDVTMPVLDGPGMVARMREKNDKTPVVMLTSESKRSIIASLMKLGISDYILKPFKPEELQAKILKALKMEVSPRAAAAAADAKLTAAAAAIAGGNRPATDVLVVDDMENVQKRLRALLPERVSLEGALNPPAALATCRERAYKVVLVDNDIPGIESGALMKQCRVLQPEAAFLMLALRTANKVQDEARQQGFDGVMFKPFTPESIEDFTSRYFDSQETITIEENTVRVPPWKGRDNRVGAYFLQLGQLLVKAIEDAAAACYADMVIDLGTLPPALDKVARLVIELRERATKVGLDLRLCGSPELGKALKQLADTADVRLFATVDEARAGKAA